MIALVDKMSKPLSSQLMIQEQPGFALNRYGKSDEAKKRKEQGNGRKTMRQKCEAVIEAEEAIGTGNIEPKKAIELTKILKNERVFWLARRVLKITIDELSRPAPSKETNKLHLKLTHQLALCTYKDPDLANDTKFVEAINCTEHHLIVQWL